MLNAEYVWGSGAKVHLRIEDHDRERCRPEYEAGILADLAWLGYRPDFPLVRQSERSGIYLDAVETLRSQGLVYACCCSRKELEARPCRCRDSGIPLGDGVGWRVRMDPGVETFVDQRLGEQRQDPSLQCGDVLIRDRLGNWTYQLAATVDDYVQGIDLVIRGEDLLESTGRQIRLARLLGRETPAMFLHHHLLMKSPDQKLSKSDSDTGVRDLRARGLSPADVKRYAMEVGAA